MNYSKDFKQRIYSTISIEFLRKLTVKQYTHYRTAFIFTRWQTKEAENETRVSIYICGTASTRHRTLVTDTPLFRSRSKHTSAVLKAMLTTKEL